MDSTSRKEEIRRLLADARRRAAEREYEPGTVIAPVSYFSREELASLEAKFIAKDGQLLLTECSKHTHTNMATRLGLAMSDGANRAMDPSRAGQYRFVSQTEYEAVYRRLYFCTTPTMKVFDFALWLERTSSAVPKPTVRHPIVCGEIAFRGEKFPDLLGEGEEMASPYWPSPFAFLFHTKEDKHRTRVERVRVIVLTKRESQEEVEEVVEGRREGTPCRKDHPKPFAGVPERLISPEELAEALHGVVIFDMTYTFAEMLDPSIPKTLHLPASVINGFLKMGDWFRTGGDTSRTVPIPLEGVLFKLAEDIASMVEEGTYPNHILPCVPMRP